MENEQQNLQKKKTLSLNFLDTSKFDVLTFIRIKKFEILKFNALNLLNNIKISS